MGTHRFVSIRYPFHFFLGLSILLSDTVHCSKRVLTSNTFSSGTATNNLRGEFTKEKLLLLNFLEAFESIRVKNFILSDTQNIIFTTRQAKTTTVN